MVLNLQSCEVMQRIKYLYYLSTLCWVKCFNFTTGCDFEGFHFPLLSTSPFFSQEGTRGCSAGSVVAGSAASPGAGARVSIMVPGPHVAHRYLHL